MLWTGGENQAALFRSFWKNRTANKAMEFAPRSQHSPDVSTISSSLASRTAHLSPDVPNFPAPSPRDALTAVLQSGVCQLLYDAVEGEVEAWLAARSHLVNEQGRRLVVRNGHMPESQILSAISPVTVQAPRVRDRRPNELAEILTSAILPPNLRKANAIDELIPWLYPPLRRQHRRLRTRPLGPAGPGRQGALRQHRHATHSRVGTRTEDLVHPLPGRQPLCQYLGRRDPLQQPARRGQQRILVLMGATDTGEKELIAMENGYAESELA